MPAARFRLLDSVRVFVLSRAQPAAVEGTRREHARYSAGHAGGLARRIRSDDDPALVTEARLAIPDAVAALDWTLTRDTPLAARLAGALALLLERALRVTRTTGDNAELAGILRRLTGEHWDLGARPQATATLAALADLIGLDAATACCPPGMRARLPALPVPCPKAVPVIASHWSLALAPWYGRTSWVDHAEPLWTNGSSRAAGSLGGPGVSGGSRLRAIRLRVGRRGR